MSADNGIYILKTGRQYRVAHLNAIDNLYWNDKTKQMESAMVSERILDMFGKGKFTYSLEAALKVAKAIKKVIPYTEYGIVFLDAERSWSKILKDCGKESEIIRKEIADKEESE